MKKKYWLNWYWIYSSKIWIQNNGLSISFKLQDEEEDERNMELKDHEDKEEYDVDGIDKDERIMKASKRSRWRDHSKKMQRGQYAL